MTLLGAVATVLSLVFLVAGVFAWAGAVAAGRRARALIAETEGLRNAVSEYRELVEGPGRVLGSDA